MGGRRINVVFEETFAAEINLLGIEQSTAPKRQPSCVNVEWMHLEDLGVIGNCQFSALVDNRGEIVWCCFPRFDSEPVFSTLLDHKDGGRFRVGPAGGEAGAQRFLPNTNI